MRRAARTDANQPAMVNDLRRLGYRVAITAQLGKGFPDLVVRHPTKETVMRLVEVKDPAQPPSKRALTEDEASFIRKWGAAVIVAERAEDVIKVMRAES